MVESKGQREILHRNPLRRITCPAQSPEECFHHFPVTEANRRLQAQLGRAGKHPRQKSREPPVPLGNFHERAVVQEQLQRAGQHLLLIGRLKMCRPVLRLGQQPVAVVNADLSACIDAVLPFPEFNQPCPVPIIKIPD